MSEFEFLRNVTIGQYIPTNSFVHRLDPRAKILVFGMFVLAISFTASILANVVFLGAVLLMALAARIPISYLLRGIWLALPVLLVVMTMQLFFLGWREPAGQVYFQWGWIRVTQYSAHLVVLSILRVIALILLTSLFTMTSTTTELTHGIESLLSPFHRIGLPAHEIALIATIALRFVPTLAEDLERIMKAQASRGAEFGGGAIWRPDKLARAYVPLMVPLFLSALRRAEDLILAMESRCYVSGAGRTKLFLLQSRPIDHAVVGGALVFLVLVMATPWPSVSEFLPGLGLVSRLLACMTDCNS